MTPKVISLLTSITLLMEANEDSEAYELIRTSLTDPSIPPRIKILLTKWKGWIEEGMEDRVYEEINRII